MTNYVFQVGTDDKAEWYKRKKFDKVTTLAKRKKEKKIKKDMKEKYCWHNKMD